MNPGLHQPYTNGLIGIAVAVVLDTEYTVFTASHLARKKPLSITRHPAMNLSTNPLGEVAVPQDRNNDKERGQQTRRVNLTVPAELLEQARRTARSLGLSLSAYVSMTLARQGDR